VEFEWFLSKLETLFKKKGGRPIVGSFEMTKFSYKISYSLRLQPPLKKLITTHFKNLTVELHVLGTLSTHVKFCVNWI